MRVFATLVSNAEMFPSKLYSSALSEPSKEQEMPTANSLGKDLEPSAPRISSHVEFPPLSSHGPSPLTACITPATPNILPSKSNVTALHATNFAPQVRDCEDNYALSATADDVSQGVTLCHESGTPRLIRRERYSESFVSVLFD